MCLVGGGQEINTGEAGIGEWIESLNRSFYDWHIYISPHLTDAEYGAEDVLKQIKSRQRVEYKEELHLAVSMRSFRAEHVSLLVKQLLDLDAEEAQRTLDKVKEKYPIVITRFCQGQAMAEKSSARLGTLWNCCFITGRAPKTSRD